jgi:ABC-type branched-subunit amino acid transport system ATPase component
VTSAVAAAAETTALPAGALLRAKGLRKSFGGVHAVRDISFAIEAGTVFAIIGPNGAGKSTLLNLLGGIYQPDAGTIMFGGRDVTKLRPHERARHGIARTFQKIRLFKQLSALDNVVAGFHAHHHIPPWQYVIHGPTFRRDQARCREEAARLLSFMGLAQRAHAQAGALSYGEQRMLEIARALATAPRLLMVDEPAAGLNGAEVEMLLDRIAMLRHDGMTLCLVEHNMDLVMKVADRILAINYGQYLAEGSPGEVQSHPGVIEAYLGGALQ